MGIGEARTAAATAPGEKQELKRTHKGIVTEQKAAATDPGKKQELKRTHKGIGAESPGDQSPDLKAEEEFSDEPTPKDVAWDQAPTAIVQQEMYEQLAAESGRGESADPSAEEEFEDQPTPVREERKQAGDQPGTAQPGEEVSASEDSFSDEEEMPTTLFVGDKEPLTDKEPPVGQVAPEEGRAVKSSPWAMDAAEPTLPPPVPQPPQKAVAADKQAAPAHEKKRTARSSRVVVSGEIAMAGEEPLETFTTGRAFGRYDLLMEMGRSGMATVYLARIRGPKEFERLVTIKRLHEHLGREGEFINMLLDEGRIAALIQHPNVTTTFEVGKEGNSYFLAMEYVHGQNLMDVMRTALRQRRSFPWAYSARIMVDVAIGVHAAHELRSPEGKPLNVVHRGVSPRSIILGYDGQVKISDFGTAYAAEKLAQTAVGTLKGKAAYMSPEQTRGEKLDRRSDIFSLGIVLYESVCLARLFKEDNDALTLMKVQKAEIPRPRSVYPKMPVGLERIILRALAKDRKQRFSTAAEAAEALEELLVSEREVVSQRKLAKFMSSLFFESKRLKDKQIQHALKSEMPAPLKGVGMMNGTDTSIEIPVTELTETGRGPRRGMALLLTAAALIAGVIALLVIPRLGLWRGTSSKKKAPPPHEPGPARPVQMKPVQSPLPPQREEPTREHRKGNTVTLIILVKPAYARVEVTYRDRKYRGSRLRLVVPRSENIESLRVTAAGYISENVVVAPTEDSKITVKLVRRRSGSRRRTRPAPGRVEPPVHPTAEKDGGVALLDAGQPDAAAVRPPRGRPASRVPNVTKDLPE